MKVAFLLLALFFSCFLELLSGNYILLLFFVANSVFYFSIDYSWRWGLISAIIGGFLLDAIYFREGFYSAAALIFVVFFARCWANNKLNSPLALNAIAGGMITWVVTFGIIFFQYLIGEVAITLNRLFFSTLIFSSLLNCIVLTLQIMTLDFVAEKIAVEEFQNYDSRRRKEEEEN